MKYNPSYSWQQKQDAIEGFLNGARKITERNIRRERQRKIKDFGIRVSNMGSIRKETWWNSLTLDEKGKVYKGWVSYDRPRKKWGDIADMNREDNTYFGYYINETIPKYCSKRTNRALILETLFY